MTNVSEMTAMPDADIANLKDSAADVITELRDRIVAVSRDIHAHPELAFEERYAAERVATELEMAGFAVTRAAYGVETSVEGVYGSGEFRVVLCAEYDALPGVGHACGHNTIAATAVGTALALKPLVDDLGLQLVVLGTPAEEHGGGKIVLMRNGAFEGAVVSAMVHGVAEAEEMSVSLVKMQCVDRFDVSFTGRDAHAAAAPHEAVNAAAAATLAEVAVGLLRQQLADGIRLSAITMEAGAVTNIVPGYSRLSIEVRSQDLDEMLETKRRVLQCMEGAAIATGCSWTHNRTEPRYISIDPNPLLCKAWDSNMARVGRPVTDRLAFAGGSTDMGNVSRVVPSIHPHILLKGAAAPPHTHEFAEAAGSEPGDDCVVDGATVLAWTIIDVAADPSARADLLRLCAAREPGDTMIDQNGD
ncbi:amidohydrolase [Rhodococcus jostii]|uniref:amidohydrolase n=1 Tax=Rhodococcus jostii TaxID=132919 RepID=UPI003637800D